MRTSRPGPRKPVVHKRRAEPPSVPAGSSFAAQATGSSIAVYAEANASTPTEILPNPWKVDPARASTSVAQVFLIDSSQRADGWIHVLLPVRPNGSTGWVRASSVVVRRIDYHIRVRLSQHRITVFNGTRVLYEGLVAVGAPRTPTPTGSYYTRVLIKAPNPRTIYGPYAYGLSSHSDALSSFDGGDAEIGIHGNDDVSALGRNVTHGCIRMDNTAITLLASVLPLGTPVDIVQ